MQTSKFLTFFILLFSVFAVSNVDAQVVVTHNTQPNTIENMTSLICGPTTGPNENMIYQRYDLDDDFSVNGDFVLQDFTFGNETVTGNITVFIRFYTIDPSLPLSTTNLNMLGSVPVALTIADSGMFTTLNLTSSNFIVPEGQDLVVELDVDMDFSVTGPMFRPAYNELGHSGSTFITAAACSYNFTDIAAVGFPDRGILFQLTGGTLDFTANKTVSLLTDANSDTQFTNGDVVQYTIEIQNTGTLDLTDIEYESLLPISTEFIVGSVATTQGTVNSGNTAGDTNVDINVGALNPTSTVTITYNATLSNICSGGDVVCQGTVSSTELSDRTTDDPTTVAENDPTIFTAINVQPDIEMVATYDNALCTDVVLNTLPVVDNNAIANTTISYHSAMPTSADAIPDLTASSVLPQGQSVFIMIADTNTGCFDVDEYNSCVRPPCDADNGTLGIGN